GLLLVATMRIGRPRDRLAVRNLRRMQDDVDAIFFLQFGDDDLHVELSLPAEQELFGLLVAIETDRGVLFDDATEGSADLVFVAPSLSFDGERDRRLGIVDMLENDRMIFRPDRVAGVNV